MTNTYQDLTDQYETEPPENPGSMHHLLAFIAGVGMTYACGSFDFFWYKLAAGIVAFLLFLYALGDDNPIPSDDDTGL